MKILTIVGARPQFIKAATVSRILSNYSGVNEVIVHTGQHFDANMSNIFFEEMDISKPVYNLEINSLSHGAMTGRMLEEIEKIVINESPDIVLVYGDTNTTLAGALAVKKLDVKLAHIEAGLRSFNMKMPEEINRILTDRISDILYCPTETARKNLQKEGYSEFNSEIVLSGDVMEDAALYYGAKTNDNDKIFNELGIKRDEYILCTLHRQENTESVERMKNIIRALNEIHSEIKVVLPLHPRTKKIIVSLGLKINFKIIQPVGYLDMINLIKNCRLVITDSGGLQKEAYFFNKFCITLRDETEWTELVEGGYNLISGIDYNNIMESYRRSINKDFVKKESFYGGGNAAQKIVDHLMNYD